LTQIASNRSGWQKAKMKKQHDLTFTFKSEVKGGCNEVQVAPLEVFYFLRGGVHQQV
jgi:hypothetical protein